MIVVRFGIYMYILLFHSYTRTWRHTYLWSYCSSAATYSILHCAGQSNKGLILQHANNELKNASSWYNQTIHCNFDAKRWCTRYSRILFYRKYSDSRPKQNTSDCIKSTCVHCSSVVWPVLIFSCQITHQHKPPHAGECVLCYNNINPMLWFCRSDIWTQCAESWYDDFRSVCCALCHDSPVMMAMNSFWSTIKHKTNTSVHDCRLTPVNSGFLQPSKKDKLT